MATIKVKKIRVNGNILNKVNGYKVKRIISGGNTYELQNEYNLVINTNNDNNDSYIWNLEADTFVTISDEEKTVSANGETIEAGSKTGYEFSGWNKSSFSISEDTTIEGFWTKASVLIGSAYLEFRWFSSDNGGGRVYFNSIETSDGISNCSLSVGDYWELEEGETTQLEVDFYNSIGNIVGTRYLTIGPFYKSEIVAPVDYVSQGFNLNFYSE